MIVRGGGTAVLVAAFLWCATVAPPAFARQAHPVSVGIGAASLSRTDDAILGTQPAAGLASWIDVPVAPRLSLESRVHWFPRDEAPDFGTRGGKTLVAMVGARGRFFTSRYVAVDGLLQTGVVHFTRVGLSWFGTDPETAPRSRLGFDMGLSAVLFPSSRWTARIDFVTTLFVLPETLLSESSNGALTVTSYARGRVESLGSTTVSVGYRFGRPVLASETHRAPVGRTGGGVSVGYSVTGGTMGQPPRSTVTPGGFLSYRVFDYLHADVALNALPGGTQPPTPWEGGHAIQGIVGLKIGRRLAGVGVFAKVRAGVVSHSAALTTLATASHRTQETGRSTLPVFDFGGVVEVDTSSRTFMRFEGGRLVSFFPPRSVIVDGESLLTDRGDATGGLQMSVGVGWRF